MFTISKPLSAGQAQSCHQTEFTAEEQNYWSQHGVTAPTRFASSSNGLVPITMTACFGDIRQHQGVEARRPFDQLQEAGMKFLNVRSGENNAENRQAGHLHLDYQPDRQPLGKRSQAVG